MKKIAVTLLMMVAVYSINAQTNKFKIGFKATPNVSWIRPDAKEIDSEGSLVRFGFGMNVDKMFSQTYAFGTGLNISQSGGKLTYLAQEIKSGVPRIIERTRTYKLQYAEVPLTLKLRTNEIGYITYWGQFGLGLGVNVRARGDDNVDYLLIKGGDTNGDGLPDWNDATDPSYEEADLDIKDDISIFRTSLIVGAGIEYNLSGNTSLVVGLGFNNGFTDILQGKGVKSDNTNRPVFENVNDNNPVQYKLKGVNNFIELQVGITF